MVLQVVFHAFPILAVMLKPPTPNDNVEMISSGPTFVNSDTTSSPQGLRLDTVSQQSGYLNVPSGNSLFYWYFESHNNPTNDPVLIWLNGGPGCSSLEAIVFENGPANMDEHGSLTTNPHSWNRFANMLYIDNPAGVGYSVAADFVSDTESASADFSAALKEFYRRNPQLKNNKLHISGESYAGRYIPVFTEAINADESSPVKISSVMIGNGLVNAVAEYQSYQPMLCGQGGRPSVLSDEECEQMADTTPICISAMQRCMNSLSRTECYLARVQCNGLQAPLNGRNPYDIRDASCAQSRTGMCYPAMDNVQDYFGQQRVQSVLGARTSGGQYEVCNQRMNNAFYQTDDPFQPTFHNVTNLLEQGTPVLAYHGDADIILNWLGGRQWTQALEWPGQSGFQAAGRAPRDWKPEGANGPKRGEVTNFEHLTFLRVADAGHMVPHDQPQSAAFMAEAWLRGDYAFDHVVWRT